MKQNPVLRKLGFSPSDRVAVIHADDVGMCHATVPAFFELSAGGLISSGSVMTPCPWFAEAAAWWRRAPEADLGVHLTLTSEWENYRWHPLTSCDGTSGMVDVDGCLHRSDESLKRPDPSAVRTEMRAQVERARAFGIEVTHLDCHMFAMLKDGLTDEYVSLGFELGLPVLMTRQPAWVQRLSPERIDRWEEQGVPVFDHLREMPLDRPTEGWLEAAYRIVDELAAGLTYWITHPALDTPELRAIASDWRQRAADYETFGDARLRRHIQQSGVHLIGWRKIAAGRA
ncbi:MAG TPA: polysaccharide deacetylase family protein [Bryobacteraceae bacterium]